MCPASVTTSLNLIKDVIQLIFQAILSNKSHPEYGVATIPFPIPDEQYDHIIELLEGLDIGASTAQDCRVDEVTSGYPILNRLVTQSVNLDELDYLAKRLESFCGSEKVQFQAMASKLGLSDIKDFINLTFSCQQATVITDFSDLEQIGKDHSMNINGGTMPMEEYQALDGRNVALDLILNNAGVITPYGVVYDNGMVLEPVYDGHLFPQYLHNAPLLTLGVPIQPEIGGPVETAWLYLPAPERQINRTLERTGITGGDAAYFIENSALPSEVDKVLEHPDDAILELNRMCQTIAALDDAGLKKLAAVVLMAQPQEAGEIRQLAENLDQFDFVPGVESPAQNSQLNELGYVAYHGTLTLDELMRDDPAEQYQREQQMGGMMQ